MTETRSVAEECEDILIEILVRVPARPLVRFKCVSKRWLSLISDPTFCRRHARRNPRPNTSAFFAPNSGAFRISSNHHEVITCDPLKFVDIDIEIVQSCNGLLLCRLRDPDSGCPTTASSLVYYVVNPTTNEFRSLTPPAAAAAAESPYRIFGYGLAFDPSISPHYKVFFLWLVYEPIVAYEVLDHRVEIFSSETQTWRLLDSIFVARPYVNYRLCTYHNGALHWAGRDCEISYYHVDEDRLGYVDGLPEYIYRRYFLPLRYFRESLDGTHLHLIDIYRTGKIGGGRCLATFQVLEMEKDYSGWSVKYNVDLDPLRTTYPNFLKDNFTVMSFAAAADDQLLLCSLGKVIVYNIRNNTFKSTQVIGTNACVLSFFFVKSRTNFHYTESLAVVE